VADVRVASGGQESVSVASGGQESVSVASGGQESVSVAYRGQESVSVASRVVKRKRMSCIARGDGYAKCPTILKVFVQFYCTLCYIQLYAHIQNCLMTSTMHVIRNSLVVSLYCVTLKPY
jgi:hypothetical protein